MRTAPGGYRGSLSHYRHIASVLQREADEARRRRQPEERPQLPLPEPPSRRRDPRADREEESSAGEPQRGVVIIPIMDPTEG